MKRALALALTSTLGCEALLGGELPGEGLAALEARERPTIELGGCRDRPAEDRCVLRAAEPAPLWIWVDVQAQAPLRVLVDGEAVRVERTAVDGGLRLALEVPAEAERLRVRGLEPAWREDFELTFDRERLPEVVVAWHRIKPSDPRRGQAIRELEAALEELSGAERLAALQVLRRLQYGNPRALVLAEQAAALAEELGRERDLADAMASAAFLHLELNGDLIATRRWIERIENIESPEARAWAHYYGGLLAIRAGDLGAAIQALAQARLASARVGMTRDLVASNVIHASLLADLGRSDEALASARETLAFGSDLSLSCADRAHVLGHVAWTHLLLAEAGHPHDPPRPLLRSQLTLIDAGGECPDPGEAALARVNLAYVALAENEPEEAARWLASLPDAPPSWLFAWIEEAWARVGLETGRDELLLSFARRPAPTFEVGLRWNAAVREAETLERFGFVEAATRSYLEAEGILDEVSSTLGINVGRELFLAGRSASLRALVDLLIRGGRVSEALCRVRLARGRELHGIDQAARVAGLSTADRRRRRDLLEETSTLRDRAAAESHADWQFSAPERVHRERLQRGQLAKAEALLDEALRLLGRSRTPRSCEALPRPLPGELTIVPFESAEGLWLFLADDEGVEVEHGESDGIDGIDGIVHALAKPRPRSRIEGVRRLRVLAGGELWSQSIHALPFADGVLLDVAPLVYSLDLSVREAPVHGEAIAAVVANPARDLPQAEAEASAVAELLRAQGWELRHRVGDQANRAQLIVDLSEARLLHYAGHGAHRGRTGWEAALLLHEGDTLGVADVLALPQVPALVVLSGCQTATLTGDTLAGGMSLGRAFVLAGAGSVVAAEGDVDDALAREVGESLYTDLPTGSAPIDVAAQMRDVQLRLRERDPTLGWQHFRVLVP